MSQEQSTDGAHSSADAVSSVNAAPGGALAILYRDPRLVAVYKPAGLLVHRTALDPDRDVALQRVRDQLGGQWVYPVHRLDRATAGVLVFARDPEAAGELAAAFREQRVTKRYEAVVRGWIEEAGAVDRPLGPGRRGGGGEPQPAHTDFQPLAHCELPIPVSRYASARYTRLALWPHTGRQHQLRRHMKAISHPIVGDTTHGDGAHNRLFRQHFAARRLLLWATRLELPHPEDGRQLSIVSEPDALLCTILRDAGLALSP